MMKENCQELPILPQGDGAGQKPGEGRRGQIVESTPSKRRHADAQLNLTLGWAKQKTQAFTKMASPCIHWGSQVPNTTTCPASQISKITLWQFIAVPIDAVQIGNDDDRTVTVGTARERFDAPNFFLQQAYFLGERCRHVAECRGNRRSRFVESVLDMRSRTVIVSSVGSSS